MVSARVQEILVILVGIVLVLILSRAYFLRPVLGRLADRLLKQGRVKWAMRLKGWSDPVFRRKSKCH